MEQKRPSRTKNEDNLKRVISECLTADVLKDIVSKDKDTNEDEIEIVSWEIEEDIAKGFGNLSVITRVYITSKIQSNYLNTVIVVKSLPRNKARRQTFRTTDFFHNEIVFYNEIAKAFDKFLKTKDQSHFFNIPKCFAHYIDGENDFIALQDVTPLGYVHLDKKNIIDYKQCHHVIKSMARFHAASFAFKNDNENDFNRLVSLLTETFYTHDHYKNWYQKFHESVILRIAKDALAKECPGSDVERRFNSYAPGDFFKKCIELCSRATAPTSVVTQGDAWAPNFLIRETIPGKFDALILDFQLARSGSPVLDIMFFIYACTDKNFRDSHYQQILKDYHTELTKSCGLLDLDLSDVYPWERFMQEIKEQSLFGFTFALEAIPFNLSEVAFDVDSVSDNEVMNIADIWKLPDLKKKEQRQRLVDVIAHAVENGYI